ncbi:MAG: SGNH/GDSL hydrolase family protein [Fimbriimonas sp.]
MKTLQICLVLVVAAISASVSALPTRTEGRPLPQSQVPWQADIERFEAEDAKHPPAKGGVVFIGSSSIAMWSTLTTDFPGQNIIKRGFGGSQLSDSVYFADRIVTPYEPKMVVLFAGTNDIAGGKSADTVYADYQAFVAKVRAKLPTTRIAYIAITPAPSRWNKVDEFRKANWLIRQHTLKEDNLVYIDTFPAMLNEKGEPRPELFVEDQLHMNPSGYAIWKKIIAPYLPWGP